MNPILPYTWLPCLLTPGSRLITAVLFHLFGVLALLYVPRCWVKSYRSSQGLRLEQAVH
jgi:hypothetical protein